MNPNANYSIKVDLRLVQCGEVRLVAEALAGLEAAYSGLYRWKAVVARAEQQAKGEDRVHYRTSPRRNLDEDGDFVVPEEDTLCLASIEVIAPAYVEIVGAAAVLETMRAYLAGKRIQWDRKRKEPDEERRLALEQRRIDVVGEEVEMLRGLNYPEVQIREALSKYVFGPLDRLDRFEGLSLYDEENTDRASRLNLADES